VTEAGDRLRNLAKIAGNLALALQIFVAVEVGAGLLFMASPDTRLVVFILSSMVVLLPVLSLYLRLRLILPEIIIRDFYDILFLSIQVFLIYVMNFAI
jgi:hypothetical protein